MPAKDNEIALHLRTITRPWHSSCATRTRSARAAPHTRPTPRWRITVINPVATLSAAPAVEALLRNACDGASALSPTPRHRTMSPVPTHGPGPVMGPASMSLCGSRRRMASSACWTERHQESQQNPSPTAPNVPPNQFPSLPPKPHLKRTTRTQTRSPKPSPKSARHVPQTRPYIRAGRHGCFSQQSVWPSCTSVANSCAHNPTLHLATRMQARPKSDPPHRGSDISRRTMHQLPPPTHAGGPL